MGTEVTIAHDAVSDVLRIAFGPSTPEVDGDFVDEDVYARFDRESGALQTVELLGFARLRDGEPEITVPMVMSAHSDEADT